MSRLNDLLASEDAVPTESDPEFANYNILEQRLLVKSGGDKSKLQRLYRRVKGKMAYFSSAGIGDTAASGGGGSPPVSCTVEIIDTLTAASPVANDHFGGGVGIKGNELFVGEIDSGNGVVRYFTRASSTDPFTLDQTISPGFSAADAEFGRGIDYDGQTLAIGQHNNDLNNVVETFTNVGGTWTQEQVLTPNDLTFNNKSGISVAVYGNWLAMGVPGTPAFNVDGAVDFWQRIAGVWTYSSTITSTTVNDSAFGGGVTLMGDATCFITRFGDAAHANLETVSTIEKWTRSGTTWSFDSEFTIPYGRADINVDYNRTSKFGIELDDDGTNLVVGLSLHDTNGAFAIYDQSGTELMLQKNDAVEYFGYGIAMSDGQVAVGKPSADPSATTDAGEVEVWTHCLTIGSESTPEAPTTP